MLRIRKVSKGFVLGIILSIVIAYVVSLIPNIKFIKLNQDYPVFRYQKQIVLTDYNLVNFISSLQIDLPIKKVTWSHNVLSIDFMINRNNYLDTDVIYRDLYTVIKKSFVDNENVDEVFLRVFLDDMNKIFVAVSAQKEDIKTNVKMEMGTSMNYRDFLERYFGLNYGNLIKQD
ncbi:hypothetical protein BHF71_03930 [Vulcanibacillus modesticaldus]|uniref:DUF4825 domain-containing protein n=1 Tax=Vulcanibacillus modesticaldus TaxID=337097 RepID=A0A1D2YSK3_9BACI|nr:hypothetical protein [Vulcanibacillus modesticaldus]OEF97292.1 hypothetical protein BHF71_03930 [Vulcanibacillus modesticaldus]